MTFGQHHLHARRRKSRGLEPFPSPNFFRRTFDYLMVGVSVVQPLALLPQVIAIYVHHSTAGVSLTTWMLLTVFNTLWAIYGILHRAPPIAIANIMLMALDLAIVLGVLYY